MILWLQLFINYFKKSDNCVAELMNLVALIKDPVVNVEHPVVNLNLNISKMLKMS